MSTLIRDLLRPLEPSVRATQSLGTAKEILNLAQSEYVVVRDLRDRPVGVITVEDITAFQATLPADWSHRRCAQAVDSMPAALTPEESPEACVQYYRENGIRPVVIFKGEEPVGVLHPSEIFQWCATWNTAVVEELAFRARSPRLTHYGGTPLPAARVSRLKQTT